MRVFYLMEINMEEQDNSNQVASAPQQAQEAPQEQYVAPTPEERAAAAERAAELARRSYEFVYPSGFSEAYPHLRENSGLEMVRTMGNYMVQGGHITDRMHAIMMEHAVEHFDRSFHEGKKSEMENTSKQRNLDMHRLKEAISGSDVSEERVKHVVYKRLEQHGNKGVANWMGKALDNPQTVALLHYMGVATAKDNAADRDLYDPKLSEADVLADMKEINDNIRNRKTNLNEAAPRLVELNEALGRLRKSGVNNQGIRR